MGQQQFMLIIFITIVIGLATIVAVNVISKNKNLSDRDAVRQDLVTAASNLQTFWERSYMLGGANRDFQGPNMSDELITERIGIPGTFNENTVENENATYTLTSIDAVSVEVEAQMKSSQDVILLELKKNENNDWIYTITDGSLVITNSND